MLHPTQKKTASITEEKIVEVKLHNSDGMETFPRRVQIALKMPNIKDDSK